jgi:sugar-specific transcriptional regulator TrmB
MESIIQMLGGLGCSERESSIYLETLLKGGGSIQSLSQRLNLNRITVHSAVERLVERGLLSESREGKRRTIFAESPEVLERVIEREQRELEHKRQLVSRLASEVGRIPRVKAHEPAVRIYRGNAGLKTLLEETLSCTGELLVIIDIGQFVTLLSQEYLLNYYERRAKRNIYTRLIWPSHQFATKIAQELKRLKMEIKLHPGGKDWKAGIFCWNDSIGIKSLTQGYLTCTIITNQVIADFFRTVLFEEVWRALPENNRLLSRRTKR